MLSEVRWGEVGREMRSRGPASGGKGPQSRAVEAPLLHVGTEGPGCTAVALGQPSLRALQGPGAPLLSRTARPPPPLRLPVRLPRKAPPRPSSHRPLFPPSHCAFPPPSGRPLSPGFSRPCGPSLGRFRQQSLHLPHSRPEPGGGCAGWGLGKAGLQSHALCDRHWPRWYRPRARWRGPARPPWASMSSIGKGGDRDQGPSRRVGSMQSQPERRGFRSLQQVPRGGRGAVRVQGLPTLSSHGTSVSKSPPEAPAPRTVSWGPGLSTWFWGHQRWVPVSSVGGGGMRG